MAALQAELKSWTANRIGDLTQTRDSDCLEIAECILENEDLADPEALKAWLSPFVTEESAKHKADSFVEALFERKAQIALLQSNPQGAAGGEGAKGKSKDGKGGAKGGRGRGEKDEDRGKGKSGKGEKQRVLPTMDMPFLPRREGDKRLMVVDASSGRHNVLTNCLNCGKVITEQEGWGPCLFCGNPLEVGDRRTGIKRGDERGRIDMDGRPAGDDEERYNASFQRAVATKDRLLSYDRDAKRRTKVYDDATDWYSEAANPWLSEKQREEAKAKGQDEERRRREERRKIHATIDIFGRTVIDTSADVEANMKKKDREAFQEWTEGTTKNQRLLKMLEEQRGIGGANAQMSDESQKLYERLRAALHAAGTGKGDKGYESLKATKDAGMEGRTTRSWNVSGGDRVEDEFSAVTLRDFQGSERPLLPAEESPYGDAEDAGQCLSMHQPWASLLVYGFKRAEGRSWSTEHRGRLWIHATSKAPDPDEVATLEERYRDIYESAGVPIPPLPSKSGGYPTSALLGCVDLEACWTQVEYASVLARNPSMPQEESQSEHVFWCLRPRRLLVPLKMGGDHKIWKLEKSALTPAQRGLQPVRWPVPEEGESNIVSPVLA